MPANRPEAHSQQGQPWQRGTELCGPEHVPSGHRGSCSGQELESMEAQAGAAGKRSSQWRTNRMKKKAGKNAGHCYSGERNSREVQHDADHGNGPQCPGSEGCSGQGGSDRGAQSPAPE